jgi:hypothetical protein
MTYVPEVIGSVEFRTAFVGLIEDRASRIVTVLGSRDSGWVNTSTFGDVCQYLDTSQSLLNTPSAGDTLYLYSSSANDASAGTGVRTVRTVYIDANGDEQVRTDTLNGTTPVSIGTGYTAIQWMESATAGSGGVAAGNISISSTNGTPLVSTTFERIASGGGRSMSGRYVVPAGHDAYMIRWTVSAVGNTMDARLRANVFSDDRTLSLGVFHFMDRAFMSSGQEGVWLQDYDKYPAGATIKVSAIPGAAAAGNRIDVDFTFILIEV